MKSSRCKWLTCVQTFGVLLLCADMADATEYTWDNWSGDSSFQTALNWSPVAVPGSLDIATFDGLLGGSGIGINSVNVAHNKVVQVMKVIDTAVVDMIVGDGTSASQFYLTLNSGDSLVIGDSAGDTASFNLKGGWLDTYQTRVGGRASFNVTGAGSVWDSTAVLISGDTVANTAGIGVGLSAQVDSSNSNVDAGSDTGSGRIVVDGTPQVLFGPSAAWSGIGALDVGPTSTAGFNFGQVTLRAGGRMNAASASVHGTTDVASTITVKTGGDLTVGGLLQIGPHGTLELFDSFSSITVGDIDNSGGSLNWTGGTLHITDGRLRIDDAAAADLDIANLTVGGGMKLMVTQVPTVWYQSLAIGNIGTGSMTVQNGGIVESYNGFVGEGAGSDGTVNVTGSSSRWTVTDTLGVGLSYDGVGRLNVTNSGEISARAVYLGYSGTADGTVTVDNGTLTSAEWLVVGGQPAMAGSTGNLTVNNGGRVNVGGTLKVWGAGTVTINGPSVVVADRVDLSAGATFSASAGSAVYANQLVGFGNHPVINGNLLFGHADGPSTAGYSVGSGQSLDVGQNLIIGVDKPSSFIISNGGDVISNKGFVGGMPGSDGSVVSINNSGSTWHISDALHVGGDGSNVGGASSLLIQNDAVVDADGWVTVWPDSFITLNLGALNAANVELVGGELRGKGPVQLGGGTLYNSGKVYPFAGVIDVDGSYAQTSGGEMACVLYGHGGVPGSDFSQLNLNGSAGLAGVLSVYYEVSYTPAIGDAFRVLAAAAGVIGRFDQVDLPDFGSLAPRIDYSDPYSVFVRIGLTGDLNGDGFVGLADLDIVLGNWNDDVTAGVWVEGDPSGDGFVGLADLDVVLGNWNAGTPPGESTSIPEPGVGVLLLGGVVLAARWRAWV